MKILTILPFKESLDDKSAGAVSIFVKDNFKYSSLKKNNIIVSSNNFKQNNLFYKNKNYINSIIDKYNKTKFDIIEIHNRPEYVDHIKKNFPNSKIFLYFHNDPTRLRNSEKLDERIRLYDICDRIIFISQWIQKRFLISFKNPDYSKFKIIYHAVSKIKNYPSKNNNILFVAKLNHSKGYHIFVKAAEKIKKKHPTWNFIAIGNEPRKKIFPNKKMVNEIGYVPNKKVLKFYQKSKICVGNSVWDEPLGRIAIEGSSQFCCPIISNVAGLKESKHIAVTLKKNNVTELYKQLNYLIQNPKILKQKQINFHKNNLFDIKKTSKELDVLKRNILKSDNINSKVKNLKVFHIANFNDDANARLYYSFSQKINYGLIKSNFIVQTLNDRSFFRKKSLKDLLIKTKTLFNEKIMNILINFKPNIILIGHVFSIDKKVYEYCKLNKIKIARWYIDSISPEFFSAIKRRNFFKDEKYIDSYFFTSCPKILNKYVSDKNKLNFIPNPVDSSIDNLKNYNSTNLKKDIFIAVSHGQNREILKKGKKDERSDQINKLINALPNINFAEFGINNVEPIWGSAFFEHLKQCKMSINISRGAYLNLYSSDRISSLIGNGLLVFINKKTNYNKFFNSRELVFFKNNKDLCNKIIFFKNNDNLRKKYAKNAYLKYHKYFNNIVVTKFIVNSLGFYVENFKKPIWKI